MNIQPPNYDKIEQKLWREHAQSVGQLLDAQDPAMLRRIRTFTKRFGFDETVVCQKIKDDFMFACHFAKNATKTGFHEKAAGDYLRRFPHLIRSFQSLSATGKNAKYIDPAGNIVTGRKPNGIKSLDFMWAAGDTHIRCFASHKFTREAGGAQDHQRDELIRLLQMFQLSTNEKVAFFAICDGPYYNKQMLSNLRQHVRRDPPYSFACPIGEVPQNVEKFLKH